MICVRRGFLISRSLTKYVKKNVYPHRSLLGSLSSLPESYLRYFIRNQSGISSAGKTKESQFLDITSLNEESEEASSVIKTEIGTFNTDSEYLPIINPEILEIKNLMDLKKFISDHNNSLTPVRIVDILKLYHNFSFDEKWTKLKKLKITDSKEFHIVLKNLHQNLSKINVDDLVRILTFLTNMNISTKSPLVRDIINHVMENINDISFIKSAMLYHYLTLVKMSKDFREKLKVSIEKHIMENSEKMNDFHMSKAIYYASLNNFSLECNIKLLNVILESETLCRGKATFGDYLKILRKIPKSNPSRLELQFKFYKFLEKLKTNRDCFHDFCWFMHTYGNDVHFGDAEYMPKLVDDIIDGIITKNMHIKSKIRCLEGLMVMRHIRHDFIKHVKDLILTDKDVMNDSYNFMTFTKALANSHYYSVMPHEWMEIKEFIEGLEILNNPRRLKELGLNFTVGVAVNLLSMGLYFPRFFTFLSEECNSNTKIFDSQLGRLRIMLLINEAITVLHPGNASRFLTPEKVLQMINKTQLKTLASQERHQWLLDTKILLERSVNKANCVLHKCRTKLGQEIDFVVAVDEDGNPFDFSQIGVKNNDCGIEDFNLPSKCKLILIFVVPSKEYNRNVKSLVATFTLKLKMLKTLGYRTLPILCDEWTNLPENEKGLYFWNSVKKKRNDLLPSQSHDFIGNKTTGIYYGNEDFTLGEYTRNMF